MIFEAFAVGKPLPVFKFQKDAIDIHENRHYRLEMDGTGGVRLQISHVRAFDEGLWRCIAFSRIGRAKCSAMLRICDKDRESGPFTSFIASAAAAPANESESAAPTLPNRQSRSLSTATSSLQTAALLEASVDEGGLVKSRAQWSEQLPAELHVPEGTTLELHCAVEKLVRRPLNFVWRKGARDLTVSRRHLIVSDAMAGSSELRILNVLQVNTIRFFL